MNICSLPIQSYKKGKASEFPGLADHAITLEELMEWIVDHATIEGEAGSDQFHVLVARAGHETMVFNATPDEKYSSFKARVSSRVGRIGQFGLSFNGRELSTMEYSHNEKLWLSSLK